MPYQVSMMGWIGSVKTFVGWVGSRNFGLVFEKVTHDQLCATLNRQPQDFGQNPVICRSANPLGLRSSLTRGWRWSPRAAWWPEFHGTPPNTVPTDRISSPSAHTQHHSKVDSPARGYVTFQNSSASASFYPQSRPKPVSIFIYEFVNYFVSKKPYDDTKRHTMIQKLNNNKEKNKQQT